MVWVFFYGISTFVDYLMPKSVIFFNTTIYFQVTILNTNN